MPRMYKGTVVTDAEYENILVSLKQSHGLSEAEVIGGQFSVAGVGVVVNPEDKAVEGQFSVVNDGTPVNPPITPDEAAVAAEQGIPVVEAVPDVGPVPVKRVRRTNEQIAADNARLEAAKQAVADAIAAEEAAALDEAADAEEDPS